MTLKHQLPPTLVILHNMPRSGGTLVSKCLGCMDSILLLSEIHPDAQHALSFNALRQAQTWHNLLPNLNWQKTNFTDSITAIREEAIAQGKQLVLRDWSHVDYLGPPVTEQPKMRAELVDRLAPHFNIKTVQLVRHPLDTWLSLRRLNLIKKHNIDIEQYLAAYRCYLQTTQADYQLVYEHFLSQPDEELNNVCAAIGAEFDSGYRNRWFNYRHVTGDTSNNGSLRDKVIIEPRPRRAVDDIDLVWLEQSDDYQWLLNQMGY